MHIKRGPKGLFLFQNRGFIHVLLAPAVSFATLTGILLSLPQAPNTAAQPVESATAQSAPAESQSAQPEQEQAPATQTDVAPAVRTASVPAVPAEYCGRAGYGMPAAIDPLAAAPGVTMLEDAPAYYTFKAGTTPDMTMQRLARCATQQPVLGAGLHGTTSHSLKYSYTIANIGSDVCRLDGIRVTLRQNMLLPSADTTGLSPSVATSWSSAQARLTAHEYEHVALNRASAQNLYNQLVGIQESCATIAQTAANTTANGVAALTAANTALDARTGHGAH